MKKNNITALLLAASALCLFSCQREMPAGPASGEEGAPITVDFSFSLPEGSLETKDMGAGEAIKNVYVAVFGESHYLNQFAKALPLTQTLNDDGTTIEHVSLDTDGVTPKYVKEDGSGKYHIRVTLAQASGQRYIHVLANVDEDNLPDFNAYENTVMSENLFTKGTQEGYWTYINMDGGISQSELTAKFSKLKLVRNYATIQLTAEDPSELTILGFDVYNVPSKGTFAAYSGSGTTYYTGFDPDDPDKSYTKTVKVYAGWHPSGSGWELKSSVPDDFDTEHKETTTAKYVFEQPADKVHSLTDPANTSAFIVAKIKKTSDGTTRYYRIDLVDNDGDRVSILRNFDYQVTVGNIGITGYDKASDAAQHPSNFNVTMDPITQAATEISNGSAIMRVEYVEKVYTHGVTGAKFKYQYLSNASNPSTSAAGKVSAVTGSSIAAHWTENGSGSDNDGDGWYEITYDVEDPTTAIPAGKTQVSSTFKVVAGTGPNKIQRVITIITMGKNTFTVSNKSYDSDTRKLSFTLHIPDRLPSSIFPLQIMFEDSNQAMSPQEGGLTSTAGDGLNGGVDKIQFQRNFRWVSYDSTYGSDINLTFKAPATAPASGTIYIKDKGNIFNPLEVKYEPTV